MTKQKTLAALAWLAAAFYFSTAVSSLAGEPSPTLLNDPVDVSPDFRDFANTYYLADHVAEFDPATHAGKIFYQRAQFFTRQAFDNMLAVLKPVPANEFPEKEYPASPSLPFSIEFVSPSDDPHSRHQRAAIPSRRRIAHAGRAGPIG